MAIVPGRSGAIMALRNVPATNNNKVYIDQAEPIKGDNRKVTIKTFYIQDSSREIVGVDFKCTDEINCILLANLGTKDNMLIVKIARNAKSTDVKLAKLLFAG